jgi:antitoxin CptB
MTEPEQATAGGSQQAVASASQPTDSGGPSHHTAPDIRRRRLLFRATHRGTFENDLMIGGFVRAHLVNLTETDIDALESVMEMPDTVLADWLTGRVPIPLEEETPMLRRMREFLAPKLRGTRGVQTR